MTVVWFLSWKSGTKIKFLWAWNCCITSKKIKRGENKVTDTFITKFLSTKMFEGVQSPKGAGMCSILENIRTCLAMPWVPICWFNHDLAKIQTICLTKLTLIFSQIEQKLAWLHIKIGLKTIPQRADCTCMAIWGCCPPGTYTQGILYVYNPLEAFQ